MPLLTAVTFFDYASIKQFLKLVGNIRFYGHRRSIRGMGHNQLHSLQKQALTSLDLPR